MTDEPIPRPLTILGGAFRVMAEELRTRMDESPLESGPVFNIFDLVDEHLQTLTDHVSAFTAQVNEGFGSLTYEPDEHFHGVASRMRAELEGILDGYDLKGHPKTGQRRSPQNRPMKAARDQVVLPRLAVIGQACFGTPTPWATLENVAMMEEAVEHGSHGGTIP